MTAALAAGGMREMVQKSFHKELSSCVVNGRMQLDVANEMGTTRMNVTISLKKTLDKLRKSYGVGEGKFNRNTFYRPEE